jgi:cytochrome c peroxidase
MGRDRDRRALSRATLLALAALCPGCTSSTEGRGEAWETLQTLALASPLPPPADASNAVADDPRAAELGQALFFDPGFSGKLLDSDNGTPEDMEGFVHKSVGSQGESGRVSCASCHVPEDGFSDTRTVHQQVSLAAGWTSRRTPSILDVGHASLVMWDGRFDSLQRQVLGVIESPLEANSSRLFFAQEIARRYAAPYEELFGSDPTMVLGEDYPQLTGDTTGCQLEVTSFTTPDATCSEGTLHGVPGDGAEYDSLTDEQKRIVTRIAVNAGKAIAAYERLLSCGTSRFDAFMHGEEDALDESEQRGAALFVGKARCVSCHSGPFFSDQQFHNVGLPPAMVAAAFLLRRILRWRRRSAPRVRPRVDARRLPHADAPLRRWAPVVHAHREPPLAA